ncbi:MAG: hypothetical protein K2O13_03550 [Lachnospiraceae bacterium]|nr:hypothetical protein [Lachnospiraceae bacterium]
MKEGQQNLKEMPQGHAAEETKNERQIQQVSKEKQQICPSRRLLLFVTILTMK